MADILYTYNNQLYINLTNQCPCACTFCIRSHAKGLGSADNLWLEHDPSVEEIKNEFEKYDLDNFSEVIFCGYGEPMCALDKLIEVADYIHSLRDIPVRVNTNGLGDLINGKKTAKLLSGHVDAVSVSLNAPNAEEYNAVTRPKFGEGSFEAMLKFARECREEGIDTKLTIVDVIGEKAVEESKKVAKSIGVPLRVRHYSE